jgi:hypothetical protein
LLLICQIVDLAPSLFVVEQPGIRLLCAERAERAEQQGNSENARFWSASGRWTVPDTLELAVVQHVGAPVLRPMRTRGGLHSSVSPRRG